MKICFCLSLAAVVLVAAGCRRQPVVVVEIPPTPMPVAELETRETRALGREIDTFDHSPSVAQHARVKQAFAEIDGEIAELVEHVATKDGAERAEAARKLADLRTYRNAEQVRFFRLEGRIQLEERRAALNSSPTPRVDGTAERLGEKIDDAARKVEDGVRDAADAIRDRAR
jgi:hypothetical protein